VPEIGVRMALGASAHDITWMVFRQSLAMIVLGVSAGGAMALAASRFLLNAVQGVRPTDPLTFAIVIPPLVAAAVFASFLPARRASRVDPLVALRQE
jgi:ABC-type antimicrobial peptide transport system permease subunit